MENRGFYQEPGMISSVGDAVACDHVKSLKQATPFLLRPLTETQLFKLVTSSSVSLNFITQKTDQ